MEGGNGILEKEKKKLIVGLASGIGAVVVVALAVGLIKFGLPLGDLAGLFGGLSEKDAAAKAESYVNTALLSGQGTATVKVVGSVGKLYRLSVVYQGKTIESYMTKDGKKFFPQVFEMISGVAGTQTAPTAANNNQAAAPAANAPKSDKPIVELFVMSYCPYGTQIEKGIIPVLKKLGDKIDFQLKFVSYTLHGEKENTENSRQYCISQTQNSKLLPYVDCFVKSGDASACQKSNGIDEAKITSCIADTGKKFDTSGTNFNVYKAENDKYGVQGSPTLVINGANIDSGRDSATLLSVICGAFKTAPSECQAKFSSASPAPGFGQ